MDWKKANKLDRKLKSDNDRIALYLAVIARCMVDYVIPFMIFMIVMSVVFFIMWLIALMILI